MEINQRLKKLMEGNVVGFATVNHDDGKPRNIGMEVNKIEGDTIIMTDNHLYKCLENMKKNPNVSLVIWDEDFVGFRIDGVAEYQTKGKWFDYVKNLESNKGYNPKGAIIIKVTEVKGLG